MLVVRQENIIRKRSRSQCTRLPGDVLILKEVHAHKTMKIYDKLNFI